MTTVPEPATPDPPALAVRLRVVEDLQRNRLTVFFRLILGIPHLIWLGLWSIGVVVLAVVNWFIVLFTRQTPDGLHRFFTMYIRYATHVYAYLSLAANPFPGFLGEDGYEVDPEIDPPAPQNRWKTGFRLVLAIPAFILVAVLVGGGGGQSSRSASSGSNAETYGFEAIGVLTAAAFLTWFFALATARAHEGIGRLQWYCLHYAAQAWAYVLLVTDRYPTSDPERVGVPWPAPEHPVGLTRRPDDGSRSRLTVFFRLLLALPHLVWLFLWGIAVFFVAIVNWFATLISGRSPAALHRFLAAYVRYETHVLAFLLIVANPFPGFAGVEGSYPVDIAIALPERQSRWQTGFRVILAIPALILSSAISGVLFAVGFLGWFAALATGRMPDGLRKLGLFALRYSAQTTAYAWFLLTQRYPYAGPPA